jgi:DNA-binding LacI/PurR family transcriptional regulator
MVYPALTTVRQPLQNMGSVAAQILMDMLKSAEGHQKRIELPTELVVRGSCLAHLQN